MIDRSTMNTSIDWLTDDVCCRSDYTLIKTVNSTNKTSYSFIVNSFYLLTGTCMSLMKAQWRSRQTCGRWVRQWRLSTMINLLTGTCMSLMKAQWRSRQTCGRWMRQWRLSTMINVSINIIIITTTTTTSSSIWQSLECPWTVHWTTLSDLWPRWRWHGLHIQSPTILHLSIALSVDHTLVTWPWSVHTVTLQSLVVSAIQNIITYLLTYLLTYSLHHHHRHHHHHHDLCSSEALSATVQELI